MFIELVIVLLPLIFTLLILVKKGHVWRDKVLFASYFTTIAVLASLFVYFGETGRLQTLHDVFWLVIFPSMLLFAVGVLLSLSRIKRHSAEWR